ncbi:ABC transporter permease [Micromonospora yangpuensis]|uniref:Transport permease protein n=1 Tax=Micromonospora yangpuensis TaxID=683228 RepID=A0A1C6UEJ4_9ACTN|nr:ABC transporter permease [Micromonospora yangpuensis]GGM06165.1 transport permease protein [Micromonospora yangpuensis]SCL52525.1 ABC-2 type transport system permease protein [Micromonospora yangpuensis]
MSVLVDGWVLTQRNILRLRHEPGTLLTIMLMPTVFVVLFGFVFGSAIGVPGSSNYREYMMPGMFVLGTGTALSSAMVDIAMDQSRGVMNRLRSLPTSRVAVPLGQSGAEGLIGAYGLVVLMAYGLIVGWRPHHGVTQTLAAIGLLLLFRYTLAWVGTYLGLAIRSASTAANLAPLTLPLTMVSNAFVPTDGMPVWLRAICEWNPLSALATAIRSLFGNPGAPGPDAAWPLTHPVTATLLWIGLLLVIFVPLSARRFSRAGL